MSGPAIEATEPMKALVERMRGRRGRQADPERIAQLEARVAVLEAALAARPLLPAPVLPHRPSPQPWQPGPVWTSAPKTSASRPWRDQA